MVAFDLQLFAEEKREPATPRRRQEARRRGQVARSGDLVTAAGLLATLAALRVMAPSLAGGVTGILVSGLGTFPAQEMTVPLLGRLLGQATAAGARVVAPLAAVALAVGLFANVAQVGFALSGVPLTPDLNRVNPFAGAQRVFSRRAFLELGKSLARIAVLVYFTASELSRQMRYMATLAGMELAEATGRVAQAAFAVAERAALALLVIGIADYLYQFWEYESGLRMSRRELKEEMKETEGNPEVRARRRERHRRLTLRRMMAQVPKSDAVVVNPTHFAVALKYEAGRMAAPMVVAKGADYLALRIREVARRARVPIIENPWLAQALWRVVEVGAVIPAELYQAVAEVLAFVYRLKGKWRGPAIQAAANAAPQPATATAAGPAAGPGAWGAANGGSSGDAGWTSASNVSNTDLDQGEARSSERDLFARPLTRAGLGANIVERATGSRPIIERATGSRPLGGGGPR